MKVKIKVRIKVTILVCMTLFPSFYVLGPAAAQGQQAQQPVRISAIEVKGNKALNRASIIATAGLQVNQLDSVVCSLGADSFRGGNFSPRHLLLFSP